MCLKKKAQLKKGDHVTSLNRNQEGGGCLVWHQVNGFLVLSLAACPWRYCLHVGRTPPAASPVCLHVLCTCGWQESLHHDCFPVSLFSLSFSCAWNILGSVLISDLCFNSSSLQTPSLDAHVLLFLIQILHAFKMISSPLLLGNPCLTTRALQSLSISYSIRVAACIISFHAPVLLGSCSPFLHCTDGETETP